MHWLKIGKLTRGLDEAEVVGRWNEEPPREYEVQSLRRMAHAVQIQRCLCIHTKKPNNFLFLTNSSSVGLRPRAGCWTRRGAPRPSRVSAASCASRPLDIRYRSGRWLVLIGGLSRVNLRTRVPPAPSPLSHLPHSSSCLPISSLARAYDTGAEPGSRANRKRRASGRSESSPISGAWRHDAAIGTAF